MDYKNDLISKAKAIFFVHLEIAYSNYKSILSNDSPDLMKLGWWQLSLCECRKSGQRHNGPENTQNVSYFDILNFSDSVWNSFC